MPLATVRSCALAGVAATPVLVEVHLGGGLPGMAIVGLPQSAVKESKDRVRAAIRHAGFRFPRVKVIVNLAPADLPKRGGRFDLPIALGILVASEQLPAAATAGLVAVGELGLGGELRAVEGALPTAHACREADDGLLLPTANLVEARRCRGVRACGVGTLAEACAALAAGGEVCTVMRADLADRSAGEEAGDASGTAIGERADGGDGTRLVADLADVAGQHAARRALEIAAAGAHNLLLCGPPGTGKSMLASRLPGILPPMEEAEAFETAAVASVARAGFDPASWGRRPFRSPHHTVSGVALVGGGLPPHPGEISLAHNGVLFLDELTEFRRAVLEVLREPMESGRIHLARGAHQVEYPARFQLVAAMNPCPCGHHGDATGRCRCSPDTVLGYRARLSAPFLDRIDLHVNVRRESIDGEALAFLAGGEGEGGCGDDATDGGRAEPGTASCGPTIDGSTDPHVALGDAAKVVSSPDGPAGDGMTAAVPPPAVTTSGHGRAARRGEDSAAVRERVTVARDRQRERQGVANARLAPAELGRHCRIDADGRALLEAAAERMTLSLRTVHRTLAVARTIADLAGEEQVGTAHLLEALGYRERVAVDVEPRWGPRLPDAG